jgi:hypothetical protein
MKTYGGVQVQIHVYLSSALVTGEWSPSCLGHLTPGTYEIGDWMGPRTGRADVEGNAQVSYTILARNYVSFNACVVR